MASKFKPWPSRIAMMEEEENRKGDGDQVQGKGSNRVSLLKLFSFADPTDIVLMILGAIGALAVGTAQTVVVVLLGELVDVLGANSENPGLLLDSARQVCFYYICSGVAAGFASYCEATCWSITGERQASRIRRRYLQAILRQDIPYFDKDMNSGEMVARMTGDTFLIQDALGEKAGNFLQMTSRCASGFVLAFTRGWKLAATAAAGIPIMIILGTTSFRNVTKIVAACQTADAAAGTVAVRVLGAIRTVASNTGERKSVQQYDLQLKKAEKTGLHKGLAVGLGTGCVTFIIYCIYSFSVGYGSVLVADGEYTGGTVVTIIFATIIGGMAVGQMGPAITAITIGRAAAFKIFDVIQTTPKIDISDLRGVTLNEAQGDIELRNVKFAYPARPNMPVLSNFCLHVSAGTNVALVGESGSGKSTVVNLLERFYDPLSGQVLLDGIDIKTMQLKWLRHQIGLVSQEPALFGTTIRENIAYGNQGATMKEIQAAAALANASAFITSIPMGYDTQVGESGVQLSGGQKQRIAIARVILKNPRILLLDEATSALDSLSEKVVQDALNVVMVGRTTMVIAHRLTTVKSAAQIAVVQRGVVAEIGSHEELIKLPNGVYTQLNIFQQNKYAAAKQPVESSMTPDVTWISAESEKKISTKFGFEPISLESDRRVSGLLSVSEKTNMKVNALQEWEADTSKDTSLWRLATLSSPDTPLIMLGLVGSIGVGMIFPVLGFLLANAIKIFFESPHQSGNDGRRWALMFVLLGSISLIMNPLQKACFAIAGHRLIRRLRRLAFANILRQEIAWFDVDAHSSGALNARLATDATAAKALVGDSLALAVESCVTLCVAMIVALSTSWRLTLVMLATIPLLALQGIVRPGASRGSSVAAKMKSEVALKVTNDAVSNIRTITSFCSQDTVLKMYDELCEFSVRQSLLTGTAAAFTQFVVFCSYALTFWYGSRLVAQGHTSFHSVFQVFLGISFGMIGVVHAFVLSPDLAKSKNAIRSIFTLIDRTPLIDSSDKSAKTLENLEGHIQFQHVAFKYPSRPDVQIFNDLCFKVKAGQSFAIVGESGSGKSTVISLLERFYDPDSGTISIDGVDIKSLRVQWLRQNIGLVSQEPVLLDGPIRDNIAYGRNGPTSNEELEKAATAATAHSFIASLPDGYMTRVGEGGIQLSGGQKQRIAIARAIGKNPKILLLDEATSALDSKSENEIQAALDGVMLHRTTIVIAHRLSTIRHVHAIGVMKNGKIVEMGTHDELMRIEGGAYASLANLHSKNC